MVQIREKGNAVCFTIRVIPRASRSELAGFQNEALKLRITSPPVDGKANDECIRVISDFLRIKKGQVTIVGGHASRTKTIAVEGLTPKEVGARLSELACGSGKTLA
jgi:uncharacterized protein (TIGR00251 family)